VGQPVVISVTSTKGGVGKTTTAANLGALLAQHGMSVLLVDADIQPSLSKYFPITKRAPHGLSMVITRGGSIQPDSVSTTNRPNLDLVVSDPPDSDGATLQSWLKDREDRLVIMKRAVQSPYVRDTYDVVVIDTQGAVGELQKTAAMAANIMISPVNPTILSAREFASGTLAMLESINRLADFSADFRSGDLYALIYGMDRSTDCRIIAEQLRTDFRSNHRVRVMQTTIPHSTVYRQAATLQLPAYEVDRPPQSKKAITAYETLHQLVWELFPNLRDSYFDGKADEK
jgi:chromosome partitioning related protein ParA